MGSSLHTWGTRLEAVEQAVDKRIIPTYVGNTASVSTLFFYSRDHPYIRGEHPAGPKKGMFKPRIIPTYVGNTPK